MTPIIVTDGTRFSVVRRSQDRSLAVGEFLFELQPIARAGAPEAAPLAADVGMSRSWVIPLEHGIHARPAAMLAACLKNMASTVSLEANGRTVNARSPVAMMSLGVRKGDTVTFHARGADAAAALDALDAAIRDTSRHAGEDREPAKRGMAANRVEVRDNEIRGVIACRGLAAGRAVRLERAEIEVEEVGIGATEERAHLQRALEKVKVESARSRRFQQRRTGWHRRRAPGISGGSRASGLCKRVDCARQECGLQLARHASRQYRSASRQRRCSNGGARGRSIRPRVTGAASHGGSRRRYAAGGFA